MAFASLVPLIFVAQVTTGPGAAEAHCAGAGNPVVGALLIGGGSTYASETPDSNTCNNDHTYSGSFRSHLNRWRATLILSDANQNMIVIPGDYGVQSTYVNSTQSNSQYTRITLCVDNLQLWSSRDVYCGWQGNYRHFSTRTMIYDTTYYGSNTGY